MVFNEHIILPEQHNFYILKYIQHFIHGKKYSDNTVINNRRSSRANDVTYINRHERFIAHTLQ